MKSSLYITGVVNLIPHPIQQAKVVFFLDLPFGGDYSRNSESSISQISLGWMDSDAR